MRPLLLGLILLISSLTALGETCMATPEISGGALYIRTKDALVALGRK